jgi:hypothetical protein
MQSRTSLVHGTGADEAYGLIHHGCGYDLRLRPRFDRRPGGSTNEFGESRSIEWIAPHAACACRSALFGSRYQSADLS